MDLGWDWGKTASRVRAIKVGLALEIKFRDMKLRPKVG